MTLDEFIKEAKRQLEKFEADWRKNHEINPEQWPLELPDKNAGLWWEFLRGFDD